MSQAVPTPDGRPDTAPSDGPYGLSYPCGEAPAPGEAREVAPGVLWIRMPLPFALNHINLWALADEDEQGAGWAIVDTGTKTPEALAAWRQLTGPDGPLATTPQGARLTRRLQERFGNHPFVGDVRGRGLFQGVELVADRASKEPFDPARKTYAKVKQEAMKRGLMTYPMGGTVDGVRGDHILLAPPFIIDGDAIDTIVERLGEAVDAATGV